MAVAFRRADRAAGKVETVGAIIDGEYYGELADPDHFIHELNLDIDSWEQALADEYDSKGFFAEQVPDDEVDLDQFEKSLPEQPTPNN